ncbi:FitA-like ribbon-helix-helix domain-containing protein [Acidisoma silvae]|uniref:Plasmid stabilization protein n=1 Tax=Acidisoma silvae TaxID=2802396 RepID=A0A963YWC0_9PROT|nr:plasmid stabilization protein [Acidisoma silvae]MCB8877358.1 plasmid stabilization protein [Acidisoma silvae]
MATLVIRNVDDDIHRRLKEQAASHGHSMEEEVRLIIDRSLQVEPIDPGMGFADAIQALFAPLGGLDLPDIPRELQREPPDFSGPEWDFPE